MGINIPFYRGRADSTGMPFSPGIRRKYLTIWQYAIAFLVVVTGCGGLTEQDVDRLLSQKLAERTTDVPGSPFAAGEATALVKLYEFDRSSSYTSSAGSSGSISYKSCAMAFPLREYIVRSGVWAVEATNEGGISYKWLVFEESSTVTKVTEDSEGQFSTRSAC